VPDKQIRLTEERDVRRFFDERGVCYERWTSSHLTALVTDAAVLQFHDHWLKPFMEKNGYRTADVIRVTPDTPNLPAIRDKFLREHTHSSSTPPMEISPTCFLTFSTRAWEQRVKPLPITGSLAAWVSGPRAFSSYRMLRSNWRRQPWQACGPFTWCDPELGRALVTRSVRRSMIFPRQDQL
jgi:hypothetical protein